jgi:hypothetical protein
VNGDDEEEHLTAPEYEPQPQPDECRDIAMSIYDWLDHVRTQAEFAKALRGFGNHITDTFADLLEPRGRYGWNLTMKRARQGNLGDGDPVALTAHLARMEYEWARAHGRRATIKQVAKALKMTPAALRSAIRRANGTHGDEDRKRGKRRK